MADGANIGITQAEFLRVGKAYARQWKLPLVAAQPGGVVVFGRLPQPRTDAARSARQHAIAESLRWGEPTVTEYPASQLVWAVPLMHNAELRGGLLAIVTERRVFPDSTGRPRLEIRRACESLRELAEQENLTNAQLLAARRLDYQREQKRAEAIQGLKTRYFYSIREVYLREEPALISAVRKDDRHEARGILNRILVEIYALGGENLTLIKSFLMELVVTMCRTAVESGGDPRELLGANYASISELSQIATEEELSHWLVGMLERIMDSMQRHRRKPSSVLLQAAMKYLAEHFDEPIGRDDVARVAGLSPAHFSRLIRRHADRGFNDLLNQLRIDRATELLRRTSKGMLQIALEVGYNDQSYFTKVFRRYTRMTPREYRTQHTSG
ncbi:MAG: helix-turn-helix domain-containing protein [Phycisphaerae bacterium]|nr:helix-turn-helix domain-containing protein [Phycisphaerae bacterium]